MPLNDIGQPDWLSDARTRAVVAALVAARPGGVRFVGGCVRNTIMKRPVDDIDIATQLEPGEAAEALHAAGIRVIPTGIDHGTITAIEAGRPFEITSLRRDVETDGRRAVIAYTQDWAEDAKRRDFRLNALYADPDGTLQDPVGGGIEDALAGRVIFIGDADQRLREDYLRILRFFRFNAWYGAGIDRQGLDACARQKDGLGQIAAERIWKEFKRLLEAPDPREAIGAMAASGVLAILVPGIDPAGAVMRLEGLVTAERELEEAPDPLRRLMALLGERREDVSAFIAHARLSNPEARRLTDWARRAETPQSGQDEARWRAARYRLGETGFVDVLLQETAKGNWSKEPAARALRLARQWQAPAFPIDGEDMKSLGLVGPQIGAMLSRLQTEWIASDFRAGRRELLEMARRLTG
ncbi:MAG: CCA tRNA nucleotidyltransferase [Gammaproteobacteria bacterium]|jgi:poly(A) polymerase|nr:CCA tRNA nucleotidyltransferase [Gammaproteobacteria bacterium]